MAGRVAGKIAIITGAASGLGAESARRLAAEGAIAVLTDCDAAGVESVALSISATGATATAMAHDVAQEADWQAVVAATLTQYGRIDVLVNNAGISGALQDLLTLSLEDWRRIQSINLDGVFLGMRHCGPAMVAAGGGSVINLSSILGKVGMANAAAYCASKGGVLLLTKAAAVEWAAHKIRVNTIHPGFIETAMVANALHATGNGNEMRDALIAAHPLGRFGIPREIAAAVVFLASDESSFMTGGEMVIDGGYTSQ